MNKWGFLALIITAALSTFFLIERDKKDIQKKTIEIKEARESDELSWYPREEENPPAFGSRRLVIDGNGKYLVQEYEMVGLSLSGRIGGHWTPYSDRFDTETAALDNAKKKDRDRETKRQDMIRKSKVKVIRNIEGE